MDCPRKLASDVCDFVSKCVCVNRVLLGFATVAYEYLSVASAFMVSANVIKDQNYPTSVLSPNSL